MPASTVNVNRNMKGFQFSQKTGAVNEKRVASFLTSLGYDHTASTNEENKMQDIDMWVGSTPVSIKAMHQAIDYAIKCSRPGVDCYFELAQQLTGTTIWEPSWFFTGKAEKYLMTYGDTLVMLDKQAVVDFIAERSKNQLYMKSDGFSYKRTLSPKMLQTQGGSYRYENSLCGFVPLKVLPVVTVWQMPTVFDRGLNEDLSIRLS